MIPGPLRHHVSLAVAVAVLAAMTAYFLFHDAYRDRGPDFSGAASGFPASPVAVEEDDGPWHARGPDARWVPRGGSAPGRGAVRLGVRDGRGSTLEYRFLPEGRRFLRIRAHLRPEGLLPGTRSWHLGRVYMVVRDEQGQHRWDFKHTVCMAGGTRDWSWCEAVLEIPEFAREVSVAVQNSGHGGALWVDALALVPAESKPFEGLWRTVFAALWAAVFVGSVHVLRLLSRPLGAAIALAVAVIVAGVALPDRVLDRTVRQAIRATASVVRVARDTLGTPPPAPSPAPPASAARVAPDPPTPWIPLKKAGHFVLFALLGWLATRSFRAWARTTAAPRPAVRHRAALLALGLAVFAGATEVLQFLSVTRQPTLTDWGIDLAGLLLGGSVGAIVPLFRAPRAAAVLPDTEPQAGPPDGTA